MWVAGRGHDSDPAGAPDAAPVFLDYQSGRRGALAYDLTSLLHSPETGTDEALREHLVGHYLDALAECGVRRSREAFLAEFQPMVLIRRLQALGAYAELGLSQGKAEFTGRIGPAVEGLRALLAAGHFGFAPPALQRWLGQVLVETEQ